MSTVAHVVSRARSRAGVVLDAADIRYATWAVRSGRAPRVRTTDNGSTVYSVRFRRHGGKRIQVVVKQGNLVTVLPTE